jgi:S-formylglutathione hydrolase FrmB/CubicO group peptidase (beta-lactamase class C family)
MRRLWAAGAAVVTSLALAGMPIVAQSPVPTGGVPASGSPGPRAAQVHGTIVGCGNGQDATTTSANGVDSFRDQVVRCTYSASDPRVSGPEVAHLSGDCYTYAGCVYWDTQVITGPDGTWVGGHFSADDPMGKVVMQGVYHGTGAYEGWSYVERLDPSTSEVDGLIYPGAPPPVVAPTVVASPEPVASPSPAPSLATIGQPADDGARIVKVDTIDGRTRDLTIESPSVGTVKVRLLLPSTFEAQPTTRWPVLYLLHGAGGNHAEWTQNTDVEALTAPTDLLVVMPDANDAVGLTGWYTDWYNGGEGGPPKWETFHLTELLQLLERNWQAGDRRVVAGLSMGGYGAFSYAARHPDLFRAAASYSGVLDLKVHPGDFSDTDAITRWGDPVANAANWDAHDPIKMVAALKGMPLYIAYGNGEPGPLDNAGTQKDELEAWIGQGDDLFVAAAHDAGITATVNAYGPGTHNWPYWQRDLHASLPMLLEALGESGVLPSPTPGASPSSPAAWDEPNTAALPDATVSTLQAMLDGWVSGGEVIGLSAAVVSPDGSWAGAAGVDAAGTAIEPTSAFSIASTTKTFVAAEVLLLASQGKIDLEAPVTRYVTLPFETNGATIRQLATMMSGFPGVPDDILSVQVPKDLTRVWTAEEIVALAKDQPRVGTLGGPGMYNGLNYYVLGMVIGKVTGDPLATVLRRDLLGPAGLDRIWMQVAEQPQPPLTVAVDRTDAKVVDASSGYLPSLASASTGQGGAGIAADAPSLARWGYLLYGGRIIDGDLVATMTTQVTDTDMGGYGFGTMVADWEGETIVGHLGDYIQYSSILLVWPGTRTAVAVLVPVQGMSVSGTLPGWALALYQLLQGG